MNYCMWLVIAAIALLILWNFNQQKPQIMGFAQPEGEVQMEQPMMPQQQPMMSQEQSILSQQPMMSQEQPMLPVSMTNQEPIAKPVPSVAAQMEQNAMPQMEQQEMSLNDYDIPGPRGPVYFKPHGDMGDAATAPNGILTTMAGSSHSVDNCNRFYCEGCGNESCQKQGTPDTDDIRRNYPEMVTLLRQKRTDEYPFYRLT